MCEVGFACVRISQLDFRRGDLRLPRWNRCVWLAIGSPLEAFDDASLTVHMVQHLLLMSVAPPLILLGAPQLPLLRGTPAIARSWRGRAQFFAWPR